MININNKLAASISLSLIGISIFSYLIGRSKQSKWRPIGRLSEIIIFPLKAGKAVFLRKAECTEFGLKEKLVDDKFPLRDRFFIAYEEGTKKRVSCKNSPGITKICIRSNNSSDTVRLSVPGCEDLIVNIPTCHITNISTIYIYDGNEAETVDCGDDAAKWLSQVILKKDAGIRLGFYNHRTMPRRLDCKGMVKDYKALYPKIDSSNLGAYSFLSSYLMINQSSLDDLNSRLPLNEEHIKSVNFRHNLTITGSVPYEEDRWEYIKIGENVILKNIKPCTRCIVTTLNPETAEFNPNCEPLKTLKTYRLPDDIEKNKLEGWSPIFGQYLGLHKAGDIKIGDIVYVKDT